LNDQIIAKGCPGEHFTNGFVEGQNKPEVGTIYVRLEKDGVEPTTLLLRPDEAQTLAWVSSGVVWSHLMNLLDKEKN